MRCSLILSVAFAPFTEEGGEGEEEAMIWMINFMSEISPLGYTGETPTCLGARRCPCPLSYLGMAVGGSCLKAGRQL